MKIVVGGSSAAALGLPQKMARALGYTTRNDMDILITGCATAGQFVDVLLRFAAAVCDELGFKGGWSKPNAPLTIVLSSRSVMQPV